MSILVMPTMLPPKHQASSSRKQHARCTKRHVARRQAAAPGGACAAHLRQLAREVHHPPRTAQGPGLCVLAQGSCRLPSQPEARGRVRRPGRRRWQPLARPPASRRTPGTARPPRSGPPPTAAPVHTAFILLKIDPCAVAGWGAGIARPRAAQPPQHCACCCHTPQTFVAACPRQGNRGRVRKLLSTRRASCSADVASMQVGSPLICCDCDGFKLRRAPAPAPCRASAHS